MNAYTTTILAQSAAPAAPAGAAQPSPLSTIVPFFFIAVIFYFLIIRPQQKRAKEHAALVSGLKVGDSIVTNSGIHGVISSIRDTTFMVKIADNVKVEIDKAAIAKVESAKSES